MVLQTLRRWAPALVLLLAAAFFAYTLWMRCTHEFPWDIAINWTSATVLRSGGSLYDGPSSRGIAKELVDPFMEHSFNTFWFTYTGMPSMALLVAPFSFIPFAAAVLLFRVAIVASCIFSVWLLSRTLSAADRRRGLVWGLLALFLSAPAATGISLGQNQGYVMVGLAVGLWAASRERWLLAGMGFGLAAMVKVSPALLILYCLLRGKWRTAVGAAVVGVALLGTAALIGLPADLPTHLLEVSPRLSAGTMHLQNQSLAAWLARLASPNNNLQNFDRSLGMLGVLSPILSIAMLAAVWYPTRRRPLGTLELGVLTLGALLSSLLTWDHYLVWAVLPLVQFTAPALWRGWSRRQQGVLLALLALGGVLLAQPTAYYSTPDIAAHWALRLLTGTNTVGLLLWLAVGIALVWRSAAQPAAPLPAPGAGNMRPAPDGQVRLGRAGVLAGVAVAAAAVAALGLAWPGLSRDWHEGDSAAARVMGEVKTRYASVPAGAVLYFADLPNTFGPAFYLGDPWLSRFVLEPFYPGLGISGARHVTLVAQLPQREAPWQARTGLVVYRAPEGVLELTQYVRNWRTQDHLVDMQASQPAAGAAQATFGGWLELHGATVITRAYDLDRHALRGQFLQTSWQLRSPAPQGYTLFVHLTTADGQTVAQEDHLLAVWSPALQGPVTTADWPVDLLVHDLEELAPEWLTHDPPLDIRVGVWRPDTGERLPVASSVLPVDSDGRLIICRLPCTTR